MKFCKTYDPNEPNLFGFIAENKLDLHSSVFLAQKDISE